MLAFRPASKLLQVGKGLQPRNYGTRILQSFLRLKITHVERPPDQYASPATVTKLRAWDGANLGTFNVGSGAVGVAFDGANIWVTNFLDGTVSKL